MTAAFTLTAIGVRRSSRRGRGAAPLSRSIRSGRSRCPTTGARLGHRRRRRRAGSRLGRASRRRLAEANEKGMMLEPPTSSVCCFGGAASSSSSTRPARCVASWAVRSAGLRLAAIAGQHRGRRQGQRLDYARPALRDTAPGGAPAGAARPRLAAAARLHRRRAGPEVLQDRPVPAADRQAGQGAPTDDGSTGRRRWRSTPPPTRCTSPTPAITASRSSTRNRRVQARWGAYGEKPARIPAPTIRTRRRRGSSATSPASRSRRTAWSTSATARTTASRCSRRTASS